MEYSNSAKILIADENPAQRQSLRDTLARNGYSCHDQHRADCDADACEGVLYNRVGYKLLEKRRDHANDDDRR